MVRYIGERIMNNVNSFSFSTHYSKEKRQKAYSVPNSINDLAFVVLQFHC